MGMDATLDVWVGFNMSHEDCPSDRQLAEAFPELVDREESDDPDFPEFKHLWAIEEREFRAKYGFVLRTFEDSIGMHGFGVKILHHDWDDGPAPFDLVKLGNDIEAVRPDLAAAFEKAGLPMGAFGVWMQTDYC